MREEEEERSAGRLEDPHEWSFQVECRGTMPLEGFGESEEEK